VQFSEKEKQELKDMIDRGEALPARYRHLLFAEPHEAELIWPGKTHGTRRWYGAVLERSDHAPNYRSRVDK